MKELNHPVSSKDVKGLVTSGKKCSKTAFPNPGRTGCPGRKSLRAMANRQRRLTLEDLPISHVVHCSPCFQEYLHLRRMSLFASGVRITAASLVGVVLCIAAVRFIRTFTNTTQVSITEQHQERNQSVANAQLPPSRVPIKIDLAAFSPTRGDEKDVAKAIHLPPELLLVTLQMPIGLEPGEYLVRLRDSAGTLYADTPAPGRINEGVTSLEVDVDLRHSSKRKLTLMIRPPGMSWRIFPAVVD